jgi:hypothetical protein
MDDWADDEAPAGQRDRLWKLIRQTPHADWLLLTKRANNIKKYLPTCWGTGYPNVWLGVSVENRKHGLPRLDFLRTIPATVRLASIEPLLEDLGTVDLTGINWAIIGGESGSGARCMDRRRQEMKDHALLNIRYAKEGLENERREQREVQRWRRENKERERKLDYKKWRRERELQQERFSARELHNPGSKVSQKARLDFDSLDFAWHWMKTCAPHMKLNSDEQDLLNWLRETAQRTFKWRRDKRREMAIHSNGRVPWVCLTFAQGIAEGQPRG